MAHAYLFPRLSPVPILLGLGAAILAADPLRWLLRSWLDPSYGSYGWVFFLVVIGLFLFSLSSPLQDKSPASGATPIALLIGAALVRLLGQMLDINTLSALTLCVDCYAIARLCGVDRRVRALSPFWLAVVFFFSLPVERLLQRTVGYGLQEFSADGACALLGLLFADVQCSGVQITLSGQAILVDLPCAGTVGLTLVGALYAVAATLARPGLRRALLGCAVLPVAGLLANTVRITGLAAGLVLAPVDVMAEPWHGLIGLITLALSALPPLMCLGGRRPPTARPHPTAPIRLPHKALALFPVVALLITALPHAPVDGAHDTPRAALPLSLAGHLRAPQPLSAQEIRYFEQYGGSAAKARFGPMGLLLTRTASPLRHLHDPEDCLRGLGFEVDFIGTRAAPVPTTVYRVTDRDGMQWRAEVSFFSDRGQAVPSVSAAVWQWYLRPGAVWSGLQRLTPWDLPEHSRATLELAALNALDLTAFPTKGFSDATE